MTLMPYSCSAKPDARWTTDSCGRPESGPPAVQPVLQSALRPGPKPYLATTHVARKANSATTTAEGTVVRSPISPTPLLLTMSGPKIAAHNTESQMTLMANDVHISLTTNCGAERGLSSTIREGSCGIAVITHLLPLALSPTASRRPSGTARTCDE